MKKIFVSSAVALCVLGSVAIAEESGAFVGVSIGYGGLQSKSAGEPSMNGGGVKPGIIAGYKFFFNENFGVRAYANFDYTIGDFKAGGQKVNVDVMNYGVNVDALYNFVASSNVEFGPFLGVGLGANTWGGKFIKDLKGEPAVGKVSTTSFDSALNIGLRGVFAKSHGVELVGRVPFMESKLTKGNEYVSSIKAYAPYSVALRYTFSF